MVAILLKRLIMCRKFKSIILVTASLLSWGTHNSSIFCMEYSKDSNGIYTVTGTGMTYANNIKKLCKRSRIF